MRLKLEIIATKFLLFCLLLFSCTPENNRKITFDFSVKLDRIWIGPDFWANRLQDWKVSQGKLVCNTTSENRNVQLLTYNLDSTAGSFKVRTNLGFLEDAKNKSGWIGIRFAIQGKFNDFRDDAIYGEGIDAGINTENRFFIGDQSEVFKYNMNEDGLILELNGKEYNDYYKVTGLLFSQESNDPVLSITVDSLDANQIRGNIGLVSSFDEGEERFNQNPSAWFDNIILSGNKIVYNPSHVYGPVLFMQYTLGENTLKLTAQLPPVGAHDDSFAVFETFDSTTKKWINPTEGKLDSDSRTITFQLDNWNDKIQVPYRINYSYTDYNGSPVSSSFKGMIQPDPVNQSFIKVAAFTGNNDLGFPDNDLIANVKKHDPDLFFFSGDQIYEGVGGYGVQFEPVDMAILDYLRKWYQFGWIYQNLTRNRPSIAIPDDHDVFHGNIWGAGGKATPPGMSGQEAQDQGGYKMPPRFVNMVQKTQTSHLPDPYDPEPVLQGINVYYTDLTYGGVSFAILEDRKFKSSPTVLLPEGKIRNGWALNPDFNAKLQSDHPDAQLLGERQLKFLEDWASDWSGGIWMKAVLSQTIFANVATLPEEEVNDQNVPILRILQKEQYAPHDKLVADMDSNGWPKSGRDRALRIIRKAFAIHIAGDQHLGSTIQYGIEEFGDAGYAICVPSVSNIWPRRWYPPDPGKNHQPGMPRYTGDYEDGFGNKMTVLAVSNPVYTGREPSSLYDRATGYGIIVFNKETRDISLVNWPRDIDPTMPDAKPYDGWPVVINQLDNFNPDSYIYLPKVEFSGIENPVVQVIDEKNSEIVYTIRISGNSFHPPAYKGSTFTILAGEPGIDMKEINGITPSDRSQIEIRF